MKRILSIILCVAMLSSMAVMSVSAFGELADQVTSENVMTLTTDKDSYMPGETVTITATMDSIWGDPTIEDDIDGYEGFDMPGAYGMAGICATLIYDTSVFTLKNATSLAASSTILNADLASFNATSILDAKSSGSCNAKLIAADLNADASAWGFLNGSGDLWQYNLTIAADAEPGTYYLPIGPYVIFREGDQGKIPVVKFNEETDPMGRVWAWLGQSTSFGLDVIEEVTYKTNYTGGSRLDPTYANDTTKECTYVVVNIGGGDEPIDPPTPPTPVDPMELELAVNGSALVPGDTVTVDVNVKNTEGITDASFELAFDNLDLKLTDITTPVESLGTTEVNYDSANKQGAFETVGQNTVIDVYFNNATATYEEDGIVVTLTFEVLTTAEGGDSAVNVAMIENGLEATGNVNIAGEHKHEFKDHTIPAECKKAGSENKVCSCGLTYKLLDIPALVCDPDFDNPITVPATCTTGGYTNCYCKVCGDLANTVTTEALGHDLKTVTTQQTCTTPEAEYQVCQREGCKYQSEVVETKPAIGHKNPDGSEAWGEEKTLKKPTTNAVGYIGAICSICDGEKTIREIPILPIVFGNCNMDEENKINLEDVTLLLKYIAKWDNLYFSPENADVVYDSHINVIDVSRLLQYIAGWNVELGKEGTVVG